MITNIPNEVIYSNVLPWPSISDHDTLYMIAKISTPKYQTRYVFIRDVKEFDIGKPNNSNYYLFQQFVLLITRRTN